jgi:ABC-2 type transport system permease protein
MKLFALQFRAELKKLFARQRTYIGFGAFVAVETLVLLLLELPQAKRTFQHIIETNGYGFTEYYSGLTLATSILFISAFLLAWLFLSLVAGDVVAKEVEDGTMRMTLCRPISRLRIMLLKYLACLVYTVILANFLGLSALAAGFIRQGFGGGMLADWPPEGLFALYDFWPGLGRYLLALQTLSLCLCTVTSLSFMFSCFDMKPAAATITSLFYVILDSIFRGLPYFESIRVWMLTTHMVAWFSPFREPFPLWSTIEHFAYLMGANATFFAIGAIYFQERDLKS